MTDKQKIINYYDRFDEWARLDTAEGRLEFDILMEIISAYVSPGATILDLGGGPGRYTAALSRLGYNMHLADLSPALIDVAHDKVKEHGDIDHIKSMIVADATDLSVYGSESMDAVLLMGPLYHLTTAEEIQDCLSEVYRVLKDKGILIAVFIPWLSGLKSVVARALYKPEQADSATLHHVSETGVFANKHEEGFQEGRYLRTDDLLRYLHELGFERWLLRSVRGLGNGMETAIQQCKEKNISLYTSIMDLIMNTATEASVLESSGHAVYIGRKA
ncbi:MAG: class I SAM-dependent methyltransferase [Bacteroidetes bacterium]|nr:class I SAM-dependent methyltransferase [Bacteroidota bacterium]